MDLSKRQVLSLIEGESELDSARTKSPTTIQTQQGGNDKQPDTTISAGVFELLTIPGIKLTEKARKKLAELKQIKRD